MSAPTTAPSLPGTRAPDIARDPGSWRDPAGFCYRRDGVLLRQIEPSFAEDWERFVGSGLSERLVADGILVPHEEAPLDHAAAAGAHRVIRPEPIDLVTYPWEWSFSQLKDAALLTLDAQRAAMEAGMTLRDASAFNVQFRAARPILIDSLSFERAEPDAPWAPYRQFCEHFLAPLALMARVDIRLGGLLEAHLDGIPLDLAAGLLPGRTRFSLGLGPHLHLHARSQRRHADDTATPSPGGGSDGRASGGGKLSPERLRTLIQSLRQTVEGLRWEPSGTEWADYADRTSYDDVATRAKAEAVGAALAVAAERASGARSGGTRRAWDLGANTGRYSRIAADAGFSVVALDIDPAAVERGYLGVRRDGRGDILPLLGDIADPTPSRGWALRERRSLLERIDADVVLALALVHHLAIGRNVPLPMIADLFAGLAEQLVIEFVPREDAMAQRLLAARRDIFVDYTEAGFTAAFGRHFETVSRVAIEGTARTLHHLRRRPAGAAGTAEEGQASSSPFPTPHEEIPA